MSFRDDNECVELREIFYALSVGFGLVSNTEKQSKHWNYRRGILGIVDFFNNIIVPIYKEMYGSAFSIATFNRILKVDPEYTVYKRTSQITEYNPTDLTKHILNKFLYPIILGVNIEDINTLEKLKNQYPLIYETYITKRKNYDIGFKEKLEKLYKFWSDAYYNKITIKCSYNEGSNQKESKIEDKQPDINSPFNVTPKEKLQESIDNNKSLMNLNKLFEQCMTTDRSLRSADKLYQFILEGGSIFVNYITLKLIEKIFSNQLKDQHTHVLNLKIDLDQFFTLFNTKLDK